MAEERNHATMRDYVLALRRRKFAILGCAIVAAVIAGAISFAQPKTYTADASLRAIDLSQSAAFAGLQQAQQNLPAVTAAQLAATATRTDVIQDVKSRLGLSDSIDQIRSRLSLSQDAQSNFVILTASASRPTAAAQLANAAANAVASSANQAQRAHYAAISQKDRNAAAALLLPYGGKKRSQLSPSEAARFQADFQQASQLAQLAARMQAFSNVVTVAQVTETAAVPSSPSSPHPISNIILGFFVGLILGLFLAWLLESLDRRLRRPDETEQVFGLPVAGALTDGLLGKTPGTGGDAAGLSAFRMIGTNVRFLSSDEDKPLRSLLVTSSVSEEGKTTVALGLALSAAASGMQTLLIEADAHRPVHAQRLGLASAPGLADYMKGGKSPSEILQAYSFVDPALNRSLMGQPPNGHASRLTCITAGDTQSFLPSDLGSQRFASVIADVSQVYDLVVIDSGPLLAVPETMQIATFVDAILFCVRLGSTTLEQARAARSALNRLPELPIGLVLTEVTPDAGVYYGYGYTYEASTPTPNAPQPAS